MFPTTMPRTLAAALCSLLVCGCGSESQDPAGPELTISPSSLSVTAGSGVVTAFRVTDLGPTRPASWPEPQLLVAPEPGMVDAMGLPRACPDTIWTLRGPGSLQMGRICEAIYVPPPAGGDEGTAVLTVSIQAGTAGAAASGSVLITIVQP